MTGCNVDLYQEVKHAFPGIKLQASGGVSSLADLETLTTDGVIIGKALYEGAFQLADALAVGAERVGAC
jgi:phosphoribosylformimino-5-aminoimidazole carboxamide ribotide isomerase